MGCQVLCALLRVSPWVPCTGCPVLNARRWAPGPILSALHIWPQVTLQQHFEVNVVILTFQIRKLRLAEVRSLGQGHKASRWQSQNVN